MRHSILLRPRSFLSAKRRLKGERDRLLLFLVLVLLVFIYSYILIISSVLVNHQMAAAMEIFPLVLRPPCFLLHSNPNCSFIITSKQPSFSISNYPLFTMELLIFLTAVLFFTIFSAAASLPKTWSLSSLLPNDTGPATISQVPIGAVIDHCIVPGTVALTFDDGPYIYTPQILDTLSQRGARATFFLNGVHMGNIHEYTDVMRRTIAEGHQLASHTYFLLSILCPIYIPN